MGMNMFLRIINRRSIISLVLLLGVGVWVNLHIAHRAPWKLANPGKSNFMFTRDVLPVEGVYWPTMPDELAGRMTDNRAIRVKETYRTHRHYTIIWKTQSRNPRTFMPKLEAYELGVPFTTRTTKKITNMLTPNAPPIWPTAQSTAQSVSNKPDGQFGVLYHPLGLIVNPILYAGPPWLVLMGVFGVSAWLKRRRWLANALCLHCGYDLQDLPNCPECGNQPTNA